ncbi:L-aminoadipate-semialdehyde dehydrogenase large subunit [Triangularia setosa]|uniref:L-aminoadipate-semialdehyde dehydrogenase large subunit n=1 Tax=Triangularia setosa TaxID=2587417 RepID=A0AAN7A4E7_9PEZI|nr:L-aminoadipate-semialdehyde dehydrogenase large subunit [Podospora setosa]
MTPTSNAPEVKLFIKAVLNYASPDRLSGCLHSLPELIDFNALNNPSHPFCIQAKSTAPHATITHGEFKVAASRCAGWLKGNLPLGPAVIEDSVTKMAPVALLMESDFGLVLHEFALMAMGIVPLVLSPRLPPVAIGALLQKTGATSFLVSPRLAEIAKPALAALAAKGITTLVANQYGHYYEKGANPHPEPAFPSPQDVDSVALLLHSSGTTGLPKPIPLTHRQLLFAANCHKFDTEEQAQGLNLSTLPLFHGFGLVAPGLSMSAGKTTLFPASDGIPNTGSILKLIREMRPRSMMTVPFLLEDMASLPENEGIKALEPMDFVGTGGAMLGAGVGDRLAGGGVKLLNFYGTTETGHLSLVFAPTDGYDWKYFRLRSDIKFEIDELPVRGDDGGSRYRLTVWAHPAGCTEGFTIPDQLVKNERYPETDFAAVGREDDVIVLATGEKANPVALETELGEYPGIKSAVVFGENQFHIGVIIEPQAPLSAEDQAAFRHEVWTAFQAIGERMDAFARVPSPTAVIVVPQGTVVPRTDKGSVARKETYALFEKEINAVYKKLQEVAVESAEPLQLERLEESLQRLISKTLSRSRSSGSLPEWTVEDSLFDLGVDSLQILQLRRALVSAAQKTEGLHNVDVTEIFTPEFFYVNHSVREMAAAIRNPSLAPLEQDQFLASAAKEVQELADLNAVTVPAQLLADKPTSWNNAVVLLTGSSGSLGSHILADLARRPQVKQIICLIRKEKGANAPPTPSGGKFDRTILDSRGLELSEAEWAKVATLEADPTSEELGLVPMVYAGVQTRVTHVVHAAWPMNYLMKLRSFQYQFRFLRSLLELSALAEGRGKVRFLFVSSIAAVARIGLQRSGQEILEEMVPPAAASCGIGYADGKLCCELILKKAAEVYAGQLEISFIRCGQIAGSRRSGAWNVQEQVPMLLKTAESLGAMPQLGGRLSWIPVDDAAKVLVEFVSSERELPLVLHLENPVRQDWEKVIQLFGEELCIRNSVPFDQWMKRVQVEVAAGMKSELYPVSGLYSFFEHSFRAVACGQVVLGTELARRHSETLGNMGSVDASTIRRYLDYWRENGYLGK